MKCPVVTFKIKLSNGTEDWIHRTFMIEYLNKFYQYWYPASVYIKEICLDTITDPAGCMYLLKYDEDYACENMRREITQDINLSIDLMNKIKDIKAKPIKKDTKFNITNNIKELKYLLNTNAEVELDIPDEIFNKGFSPYTLGTRC